MSDNDDDECKINIATVIPTPTLKRSSSDTALHTDTRGSRQTDRANRLHNLRCIESQLGILQSSDPITYRRIRMSEHGTPLVNHRTLCAPQSDRRKNNHSNVLASISSERSSPRHPAISLAHIRPVRRHNVEYDSISQISQEDHHDRFINFMDMDEQIAMRTNEIQFRRSTFWKSCCGMVIDKRATQFFVQVTVSMIVMVFCMYKISTAKFMQCSGEDTTVYWALISSIVSWFLPSPSFT
jgi:hypothetical protein